jgi:hypothetical protein
MLELDMTAILGRDENGIDMEMRTPANRRMPQ